MKGNWKKRNFKSLLKQPIRDFGSFSLTNLIQFQDSGIPFIKSEAVQEGYIDFTKITYISNDVHKLLHKSIVQEGDLLFTKIGAICRGAIYDGSVGVCNSNAATAKISINSDITNKYYILYLLLSDDTRREFEKSIISTPPRINLGDIDKLVVNLPPLPQQQKIAKILSTCDEVIEKTEAAIAKYQSIKQGMMHDLFTRGIDLKTGKLRPKQEEAPELYKESELGWIPKEWEVKRLEEVSRINGRVGWKGYTVADLRELGPLAIGAGQIDKNNRLDLSKPTRLCYEKYIESPEIMVKKNDLLIVQRGTIGKYVIIDNEIGEATINPSMVLLNNLKMNAHYLYYSFGTDLFNRQVLNSTSQTGVPMISQEQIGNFKIPKPQSSVELEKITKQLHSIDQTLNIEQSTLAKYQQLKSGLMQDLLTGKVEVIADTVQEEIA
jgi:type I restriction enzyme, S subunit